MCRALPGGWDITGGKGKRAGLMLFLEGLGIGGVGGGVACTLG